LLAPPGILHHFDLGTPIITMPGGASKVQG